MCRLIVCRAKRGRRVVGWPAESLGNERKQKETATRVADGKTAAQNEPPQLGRDRKGV